MNSSIIVHLQQRPRNLALLIAGISILVLLLNGYGLMIGITNVLPHLFYIPIILVAYFFPRRGILFALAISAIYCGMTYLVNPAIPGDLLSAGGRIILFILIAAVVSILTLRMRESEHRHAMLLDAIPDMIFVISRDGFYRDFRSSEKTALLIPPDQIIGKSIRDTGFSSDLAEEIHQHIARAIETNTLQKFEYDLTIPQGMRQFEARIVALNQNEVLAIVRDITERKLMETAIREVNRKLNLLSSITRHDIRNQLLALTAYLELSKETLGDAAKTSEYIIKEERAANAIERQIVFTKEYQDLGVKDPVWQNLSLCINHAVQTLPMRDIRVIDEVQGIEIYADSLFEKVFYNLMDNALRYGGTKMTTIRFMHHESGQSLVIAVEDDGIGISAEDKKRLFERGFGHHTGLGLFLSREILSITGITINENGESGKGARFEIVVPKEAYRFSAQEPEKRLGDENLRQFSPSSPQR